MMKILLLFACFAISNANPDDHEPSRIFAEYLRPHVKANESVTLLCHVKGYQLWNFTWTRHEDRPRDIELKNYTSTLYRDENHVTMTIRFPRVSVEDSGLYFCSADSSGGHVTTTLFLHVVNMPHLRVEDVEAAGVDRIAVRWNSSDAMDPDQSMCVHYIKNGTKKWQLHECWPITTPGIYVLTGFEKNTAYQLKIVASNSAGDSPAVYSDWVTTWDEDPDFIPNIWINATTSQSITIGWSMVPAELENRLPWCKIIITPNYNYWWQKDKDIYKEYEAGGYIFDNLIPNTRYKFKAAACAPYSVECGNYSIEIDAITLDTSDPEFVPSVIVEKTTLNSIGISWSRPPPELRYRVRQYRVTATHLDEIVGPIDLPETVNSYVFQNLSSGTEYQIKVAVCSNSKTQCGPWSIQHEVTAISKAFKPEPTIMALIFALDYLAKFDL